MSVTISLVKYLNSVPLYWGLTNGPFGSGFEKCFGTPSECSRLMAIREASIGLIPVVEYQNIEGLQVLPDISISSFGPVKSVILLSKRPAEKVERVALDESSRASAILVRLLLERLYDNRPEFVTMPPDPKIMLSNHDAALLIGDVALRVRKKNLYIYDLAAEWAGSTGLPFVFAFWALRPSPQVESLIPQLYESKRYGLTRLLEIADDQAEVRGLTVDYALQYLSRNVDYDLGDAHLAGLQLFYRLGEEHGLLPNPRPLEFASIPSYNP